MTLKLSSIHEITREIAQKTKLKRLSLNLTQKTVSKKSGVSYSTLKKFERTGQISLESLLKIALVLDELENFEYLFAKRTEELPKSLDDLLIDKTRKRGRK